MIYTITLVVYMIKRVLLPLFVIWESINFVIASFAPLFIPYLGFFSYPETMDKYNMPPLIQSLTNFDGILYILIATEGYYPTEQAYFPLFPLLIRVVIPLTNNNPIIAGVLLSHTAFIFSLIFLFKLLNNYLHYKKIVWFFLFLFAYPTSYYFGVVYTESVFLFFLIGSIYFFKSNKYFLAFLFAYCTGLTRVVGLFLILPLFSILLERILPLIHTPLKQIVRKNLSLLAVCLAPLFGLLTYSFYLFQTTGDPLYFFHAQEDFGANRSSNLVLLPQVIYRYIKIFLTADKNFQYFVAILELSFLLFACVILLIDLWKNARKRPIPYLRLGLNAFSWVNLLLSPLTGTLTAIPRYTLLSLSIFLALGEFENKVIKVSLLLVMILFHILLFAFFIQGYYIT